MDFFFFATGQAAEIGTEALKRRPLWAVKEAEAVTGVATSFGLRFFPFFPLSFWSCRRCEADGDARPPEAAGVVGWLLRAQPDRQLQVGSLRKAERPA